MISYLQIRSPLIAVLLMLGAAIMLTGLTPDYRVEPSASSRAASATTAGESHVASLPEDAYALPTWFYRFMNTMNKNQGFFNFLSSSVTILFTAILAVYTVLLYRATAALADAERPMMMISDLTVDGLTTPPDLDGRVTILIEYKFKNFGRSPAFLRRYVYMISFAPELKAQPEYGDYQDSRFVIANGSAWGSINPHKIAISGEDVRDFHLGINSIVVYGAIEYRGLSRALLHRSRFAYTMLFEGGGRSVRFYPDGPEAYWENS